MKKYFVIVPKQFKTLMILVLFFNKKEQAK